MKRINEVHYLSSLLFLAACWMITPARAGTITVLGTSATAAAINCNMQGPFFAMCSQSVALGTATAVADVLGGHLGVLAAVTAPTFAGATASINVGLALDDMTADDFLEIDMSLHGTFTNAPGNGASVSLTIDNGDSIIGAPAIGCNFYNVQNYGVPCYPGGGALQTIIPLVNLDNLYLTWLLQPGLGTPPASADFLNSAHFTITVPSGTVIKNNPGGSLFQTAGQTAAVPEPSAGFLIGSGLVLAILFGKRQSDWMRFTRPKHFR